MKSAGLTENGDSAVRIAGGDRRVSTAPDFLLEARLFQINHGTGFGTDTHGRRAIASTDVISKIKRRMTKRKHKDGNAEYRLFEKKIATLLFFPSLFSLLFFFFAIVQRSFDACLYTRSENNFIFSFPIGVFFIFSRIRGGIVDSLMEWYMDILEVVVVVEQVMMRYE